MTKKEYAVIGKGLNDLYPVLAQKFLRLDQKKELRPIGKDLAFITQVFCEYFQMNYPFEVHHLSTTQRVELDRKFVAFAVLYYDPYIMLINKFKNVRYPLRQLINNVIGGSPARVSILIRQARVHLSTYEDFKEHVDDLMATALKHRPNSY